MAEIYLGYTTLYCSFCILKKDFIVFKEQFFHFFLTGSNFFSVPPNVSVVSASYEPHMEGKDTMNLTCLVEANPPAEIAWRRRTEAANPALVVATGRSLVIGPVRSELTYRRKSVSFRSYLPNEFAALFSGRLFLFPVVG